MSPDRHTVSESADKIVLKATVKRGSGTRDEDKIAIKIKDDDPATAVEKLNATVSRLEATTGALREMQPEADT